MRKFATALALVALGTTGALSSAALQAKPKSGEEQLAKLLEGRVAGDPVRCIDTDGHSSLTIIDHTALVYDAGKVIYVNRTKNPETLDWNDILVIEPMMANRLCRLDHVNTVDRSSGFNTGPVFLDEFVPYTKPAKEEG